ncbi:hypothetical protein GCM10007981_09390 [Thermocladium modestius]|uniref:Uncharacterized protein n=2 Tax=Thermocladium modestius TaxID=62609 RepID=A0A830GVT0_9CREN|nr:hypothetical protein GCM10007981_09390 [Thermocladium modestius]
MREITGKLGIRELMYRELLFQGVVGSRLHGLPTIIEGSALRRVMKISYIQKAFISLFIIFMYVVDVALIKLSATFVKGLGSTASMPGQSIAHIVGQLNPVALSASYPLTVFSYTFSILLIDTLQLLYSIRGTYLMDFFLVLPIDRESIQRGLIGSTLRVMDAPLAANVVVGIALSFFLSPLSPLITAAAIIYAFACFSIMMMVLTKGSSSMMQMMLVSAVMIAFLMIGSFLPLIMMEYSTSTAIFTSVELPLSLIRYVPIINLVSAELSPASPVIASVVLYSAAALAIISLLARIDYRSLFMEGGLASRVGSIRLRKRNLVVSMILKELKAIYRSSRLLMMTMVPIAYGIISLIMVLIVPYKYLSPRLVLISIMPFELMMSIVTVMIVYLSYMVDLGGYYLLKMLPLGRKKILESKVLLSFILYLAFSSPLLLVLGINALLNLLPIMILEVMPIMVGVGLLDTTINSFMKQITMGTLPLFMIILIGLAVLVAVLPLISAAVLFYVSSERAALMGMGVLSLIELAVVLIVNILE